MEGAEDEEEGDSDILDVISFAGQVVKMTSMRHGGLIYSG